MILRVREVQEMKKYLSLLLAIILVTATSVGTVFADSNLEGMPDSLKNIVKDNYWAELEYKNKNASREIGRASCRERV